MYNKVIWYLNILFINYCLLVFDYLLVMFFYKFYFFVFFYIIRRFFRFLCNSFYICLCDRFLKYWFLVFLIKLEIEDILIYINKYVFLCINCNYFLELYFIMFKLKIIFVLVSVRYIFFRNILILRILCRWLIINFISRISLIR